MSFALYLDENVDSLLADMLQALGYDVLTTQAAGRRGRPDDDQLAYAATRQRAILTHDRRDYERLSIEWAEAGRQHAGILICKDVSPQEIRTWILDLFELYPEGIPNLYLILPLAP